MNKRDRPNPTLLRVVAVVWEMNGWVGGWVDEIGWFGWIGWMDEE